MPDVDIYPVGWLAALLTLRRAIRARHPAATRHALRRLRSQLRYDIARAKARDWRSVRNSCNGYLAEPYHWPQDGTLTRCGTGWTRRRALRSLHRHGYQPATTMRRATGPALTCPAGRRGPLPPISPECYPPDAVPLPTTGEDHADARR